jgi:hypothetical protein
VRAPDHAAVAATVAALRFDLIGFGAVTDNNTPLG